MNRHKKAHQRAFQSYLVKPGNSPYYYFRIAVPPDIKHIVRRKELRYSLRTSKKLDAQYKALKLVHNIKNAFKLMREVINMSDKETAEKILTLEYIDKCLEQYLQKTLQETEMAKNRTMTREEHDDMLDAYSFLESDSREALGLNDYREIKPSVDLYLTDELGFDQASIDRLDKSIYNYLCRSFLRTNIKFLQIEQRRLLGDYSYGKKESARLTPKSSAETLSESSSVRLTDLVSMFVAEKKKEGTWERKTELEFMATLNLFEEISGNLLVSEIDHTTTREYKTVLMMLPPNIKKSPQYRGLHVHDVIKMVQSGDTVKSQSVRSINKKIAFVSQIFAWAVRHGYMQRNPAEGIKIRENKKVSELRAVYTIEDLNKVFRSEEYVEDSFNSSYKFWSPIIALFTGMRQTEIGQLSLDDIYQADCGTWVFDINNRDDSDKKLKTTASKRLVPIHNFLLQELNFLGYVQRLKDNGEYRLFPDLNKGRDGYGQAISKWYALYRKSCGVGSKNEKKDFHSYRHTFINTLKQLNVDHFMLQETVGHSTGSITFDRYGKSYEPRILKENVIDKLKYDIDLSHLSNSRFVVRD